MEIDWGWLEYLQWPALVVTVLAAWMVSLKKKSGREIGFWLFLFSNILWGVWGIYVEAYALLTLQLCLSVTNIHGIKTNRSNSSPINNITEPV